MSDRIKGLTITFEKDIREEEAQHIIQAIEMIKGIASVKTSISDVSDQMNRERIRYEIRGKFINFLTSELS